MTNARVFGTDRLIGGVQATSASIQLLDNTIINIPDGFYHQFSGAAGSAFAGYTHPVTGEVLLSWWNTLIPAIEAATGHTVEFKAQDSTSEMDRGSTRMMMRLLDGETPVGTFGFNFNGSGTNNFDPEWLGFFPDTLAASADSNGWVRSEQGVKGVWCSVSEHGGRARRKAPKKYIDRRKSSGSGAYAARAVFGRYDLRLFEWAYIPGAAVIPDLARDPQRAKWAGVPVGSTTQNFLEIWEQLGDGRDIFVVHDHGDEHGFELPESGVELVRVFDGDWISFDSVAQEMAIDARDQYVITLPPLWIRRGSYDY